ncbi:MAG: iron ABC transporter permease [Proteocatella sp.]
MKIFDSSLKWHQKLGFIILYLILFFGITGFIIAPIMNTVFRSFDTQTGSIIKNYIEYFAVSNNFKVLSNTLRLGIFTVITCGLVGTSLAFYMGFINIRNRKLVHILLLSPMMVPGVIIVISFIQLYGESGLITKSIQGILGMNNLPYVFNGFGGILFIHTYTQYVYFYLNISISLKYLDYSTVEAARSLGASKLHVFRTVLLPFIAPALISSAMVTFIAGISSFSAPNLLGGRYKVLSTQIMLSKANNHMDMASMQVVVLMAMGLSILFLMRHFEGKYSQESSVRGSEIPKLEIENNWIRITFKGCMSFLLIMITLPVLSILILSFASSSSMMMDIFPKDFGLWNYSKIIEKKRVLKPFLNSIIMSLETCFIGLGIALPVAYLTTKKKNILNRAAEILIMLPLVMPASTVAINLINTFNRKSLFSFNKILIGTYWILPLAYIIIALPIFLRLNIIAMESFNINFEYASRSLGAGSRRTFIKITAPIIMPAIISGATLVFIKTLGEYTMSALLYGVHNRPVSIAMVSAMQEFDIGLSMAYGSIIMLICFVAMVIILRLDKDKYSS